MSIEHPLNSDIIISVILAAGQGTRMNGYEGNKTLLPLQPEKSIYEGRWLIIEHILEQLPYGPKVIVTHHCKEDVMAATCQRGLCYCEQPVLNGTGGALLATEDYIRNQTGDVVIITMGDVPFVRPATYCYMVAELESNDMVVLGFTPEQKHQYGLLELNKDKVKKIIEWKYWKDFS